MSDFCRKVGFAAPAADSRFVKRRHAVVELMATIALAVSLIVALTAVSIGAAHAQVLGLVGQTKDASLALAAVVALAMAAVGRIAGLTGNK